ncbi:hypothetical protein K458DRAFT_92084 [Lentithecium fluviatile CBS 122367]|uniref:Uncharacterized protein n=1 Tax=Lentithecium fluviatile CBS 122367 TaxID=1168545 RepID=A0A6G1IR94_9PLEO|nr:hypothetical protein K458DRAFT_92084 [Lentithecium fluviatile CBS 122367]
MRASVEARLAMNHMATSVSCSWMVHERSISLLISVLFKHALLNRRISQTFMRRRVRKTLSCRKPDVRARQQ